MRPRWRQEKTADKYVAGISLKIPSVKPMILGFDIVGKSFEGVEYSPKEIVMKKITSGKFISSMRIFGTDVNGEMINFNGLPLRFELGIM